jgi:hypothetical protein
MEKPAPIGGSIFDFRVIMTVMRAHNEVAMLGGDGMGPSTRVPIVRCAWAPVVTSYHA